MYCPGFSALSNAAQGPSQLSHVLRAAYLGNVLADGASLCTQKLPLKKINMVPKNPTLWQQRRRKQQLSISSSGSGGKKPCIIALYTS